MWPAGQAGQQTPRCSRLSISDSASFSHSSLKLAASDNAVDYHRKVQMHFSRHATDLKISFTASTAISSCNVGMFDVSTCWGFCGKIKNLTTLQKKKECVSLVQKRCVVAHSLKRHVNTDNASLPVSQKCLRESLLSARCLPGSCERSFDSSVVEKNKSRDVEEVCICK